MAQTFTEEIAGYAAETQFARLPTEVVERVKLILFDEWACAFVGRELIAGDLIARFAAQMGGAGEATVIGTALRVPVAVAALANGTAGHADEFDGAHVTDGHPGAVIVHAVTALAESRRATGRALINAVSLGYDIGTRIVAAVGGAYDLRSRVHVHSDHLHGFGAAVAGARLISLGADGIRHAAALAAGGAGGLATVFEERRHMSKALSTGQAASAGATAAILASIGFEGHENVFDSKHGPLAWGTQDPRGPMLERLGIEHAVMGSNFKFYSAGYPIHAPVEAALNILSREGLATTEIAGVEVRMATAAADTVNNRDMPSICVQDMVALAMVHGELGFDLAHSSEALGLPEVSALRSRIVVVPDPEIDRLQPRGRGAKIVIHTQGGARHEEWIEHPRGHALRERVGWPDLHRKWDELLSRRMGERRYEGFQRMCASLEALEDVTEVTGLLRREA